MWVVSGAMALPPRVLRMALEPRLMLDADAIVAVADAASAPPEAKPTDTASADTARHEIVFVLADVANWQQVTAVAPAGAEVIVIDPAQDGLARMEFALQGRQDIDAIHVIAHGAEGAISLGSAVLDINAISSRSGELAAIGAALAPDGDLLFYGCETGKAEAGWALAQALADATGADVALSSDDTGAADLGGDWDLESRVGSVETVSMSAEEWESLLAVDTTRTSVATAGTEADAGSNVVVTSSTGRYVAFSSTATNLVAGDTNGVQDVFVRDTQTNTTSRISVGAAGAQANNSSTLTDISDDGRYVVFTSLATDLVAGDTNGEQDVFVHDIQTATTTRVSVTNAGGQATGGASNSGTISGDGRYVAFLSSATNVVAGDVNGVADVFVRDLVGNTTTRVSIPSGGGWSNGAAVGPQISSDGSTVVFSSAASNMVAGDTNGATDVFVRNLTGNTTQRVNTNNPAGADSASVSGNGAIIAFRTAAALVAGDTNGVDDIYVRDMGNALYTLVTNGANGASAAPVINGAGDVVAFDSAATNLVTGDTNAVTDVFVWKASNNTVYRVSLSVSGTEGSGASDQAAISSDGTHLAFRSAATNLVAGDGNVASDVFTNTIASVVAAATPAPAPAAPAAPPAAPITAGPHDPLRHVPPSSSPPPPPPPSDGVDVLAPSPLPAPGPGLDPGFGQINPIGPIGPIAIAAVAPPPPPGTPGASAPGQFGLRPGMPGFDRMGFDRHMAMLRDMDPRRMREALQADSEPAAEVAVEIVTQIGAGKDVSLSDAKEAMEKEGVSPEKMRAYLAVVRQAIKTQRTETLAGALNHLATDAKAADSFAKASDKPLKAIEITSNKVALVIGVNTYSGALPSLATPGNDAAGVSAALADKFGYQTIVAENATKADIIELMRSVGERMNESSSLVVYYAGHGYAVESTGEGYWLPSDAKADSAANWISTRDLTGYLGQIKANQIMVVSDSCYSGALTRESRLTSDAVGMPKDQIAARRSVTAFSSGGDEPVADTGGANNHSVFAANLIQSLEQANSGKLGFEIFSQVRAEVARDLPQIPTYGGLTSAGHAGATDFVIGGR